jgi:hypothetical protein
MANGDDNKNNSAYLDENNAAYEEMNRLLSSAVDRTREMGAGIKGIDTESLVNDFIKLAKTQETVSDLNTKIAKAYKEGNAILAEILVQQKEAVKQEIERQKILNETNKVMKSGLDNLSAMAKKIPIIGDMLDKKLTKAAGEFAEELATGLAEGAGGFSSLGSAASKAFGGISAGAGIALVAVLGIAAALYGLYTLLADLDATASKFAKELGMSSSEAASMGVEMRRMGISLERSFKTVQAFNDAMGGALIINKNNVDQFEEMLVLSEDLQRSMGLTETETAGLAVTAKNLGMDMDALVFQTMEIANNTEASTGHVINQNKVLKDLSKLSKTTATQFSKYPQNLIRAASAAAMLGTDIGSMIDASTDMLDIESALEKEMMARALTGKDINYDVIREARLRGDAAGVLEGQVAALKEVTAEQMKNPILAKRFADSLGLSTDEAIKMQENIAIAEKAGIDMVGFLQGTVTESQLRAGMKNLSDEEKARLNKMIADKNAASVQEEFNEAMLALKEALLPLLGPLTKFLKKIAKGIEYFSELGGGIGGMILTVGGLVMAFKMLTRAANSMRMSMSMGGMGGMGGGGGGFYGGGGGGGGTGKKGRKGGKFKKPRGGRFKMGGRMGGLMNLVGLGTMFAGGGGGGGGGGAPQASSGAPKSTSALSGTKPKAKGGGGFFGKIGGFLKGGISKVGGFLGGIVKGAGNLLSKLNPMNLLKKAKAAIVKNAPKLFKTIAKIPVLSTFLEGLFAHSDIMAMMGEAGDRDELFQGIGKRVLQGVGGVLGGAGAAAIVQALNILPGLGVLASPLAYLLGDTIGRWLGGLLADNAPGLSVPIGKFVGETFYGDSIKKAFASQDTLKQAETNVAAKSDPVMDATKTSDTTTLKANDFTIQANPNDKIGGVLDNKSVEEMVSLMRQMVSLLSKKQTVVIGDNTMVEMSNAMSARKSFVSGRS